MATEFDADIAPCSRSQRCRAFSKWYAANSGETIPPEAMEPLFQPFYRVVERSLGLGLGLYIASEIARTHGGALGVDSSREETGFTLRMRQRK
jgi:sigma-B regulation protein RsbU (phosphoserine phosphatase)